MSYTVDLEVDYLDCRTREAATKAAAVINGDPWMRLHLRASPTSRSFPERDNAWALAIDEFDGCSWDEPSARRVWLAIAPYMANTATLEFRHEEDGRFRIRWEDGRVFEEFPEKVIWALECEITQELLDE